MKRKAAAIIIIITLLLTSFSPAFAQEQFPDERLKELENYIQYIKANYKDEVDYETLINGAFEGAMNALGDLYSVYYSQPPEKRAAEATGEYVGIGVRLETTKKERCLVVSVSEGSPAEKAGVLEGDIIIAVDGKDVTSMRSVEIVNLLRGEEGSAVCVTISRKSREQVFELVREKVEITISFYEMMEEDIGYFKFKNFEEGSPAEFNKAKAELIKAGAKSLIIDLRDNPGGSLNAALAIAGEFVEKGDLLHLVQKGKIVETVQARNKSKEKIRVILLVNENSMSAAEILAAALQDNNAATLIGITTYGKGTAQATRKIDGRKSYRLSMYEFLRPNKEKIEGVGVTPDYEVKNNDDSKEDLQLKKAVELLKQKK